MSTENLLFSGNVVVKGTIDDIGIHISEQSLALQCDDSTSCSCYSSQEPPRNHIPFHNILWCTQVDEHTVEVTYIVPAGKSVRLEKEKVEIMSWNLKDPATFILNKAYCNSKVQPSVLVILNRHGGRGDAVETYKNKILPVLQAAHVNITYRATEYPKHGSDIAREVAIADLDIVACCSGDGIPHEVLNGLYQRPDRVEAFEKLAITQLPCGSGNALSLSTHGTNDAALATFHMLKLQRAKMDLMAVTQGTGERQITKVSFLSQAYGVIADSDIGTEHLRWLGPFRFDLGVAQRVITKAQYPCDLWVKYATSTRDEIIEHFQRHRSRLDVEEVASPLKLKGPSMSEQPPGDWHKLDTSTLSILYVGNMPYVLSGVQFFPAALPNDGAMDMVMMNTKTPFFTMAKILTSVDKGAHVHSAEVHHAKISAYRLVPKISPDNHYISVDGESFPFEPFQVEIMPGTMTGLLRNGAFVDTCFTEMG